MSDTASHQLTPLIGAGGATHARPSTLVVDQGAGIRDFVQVTLAGRCDVAAAAASAAAADSVLTRRRFDLLVVNTDLPDANGIDWIHQRRRRGDTTPVIFVAEHDESRETPAPEMTATEWLPVPFSVDQMLAAVSRALGRDLQAETDAATEPSPLHVATDGMVHRIVAMEDLLRMVRRVARGTTTILLEGESGTGKEVIARCIHDYSQRRGAFVPINCSSISPDLFESELFGHTRGAFTGASERREGVFSYAHGGTLLLDEICDMPLGMQAKLLRVLEERAIRPVGADREQPVDVRVIAATNRSVSAAVTAGSFREDLFHRLNVVPMRLPPLRERPADIPPLIRVFCESLARKHQQPAPVPSEAEMRELQQYAWPGNVRELKNVVERALLIGCSLVECIGEAPVASAATGPDADAHGGYPDHLPLADVERLHVLKVLDAVGGNKSEAARRLGVSRKTVERKLREWSATDA